MTTSFNVRLSVIGWVRLLTRLRLGSNLNLHDMLVVLYSSETVMSKINDER